MQVETTIQMMFNRFPMLYGTRQDCYNHLFCVIGNGYRWWHGQLVTDGPWAMNPDDRDEALRLHDEDYIRVVPVARQSKRNLQRKMKLDALIMHDDDDCPGLVDQKWYPLCTYSAIYHVPSDVKPDWKKAAEECKAMLINDGVWKEYEEAE